jgi:hypothetical protein
MAMSDKEQDEKVMAGMTPAQKKKFKTEDKKMDKKKPSKAKDKVMDKELANKIKGKKKKK